MAWPEIIARLNPSMSRTRTHASHSWSRAGLSSWATSSFRIRSMTVGSSTMSPGSRSREFHEDLLPRTPGITIVLVSAWREPDETGVELSDLLDDTGVAIEV